MLKANNAIQSKITLRLNPQPIKATCTLGELLQTEEMKPMVESRYPLIFSTILLRIGTAAASLGDASQQAIQLFKEFLKCAEEEEAFNLLVEEQTDFWPNLSSDDYHRSVTVIISCIFTKGRHKSELRPMFEFLVSFLKSAFIQQRIIAAAIIAEFINYVSGDDILLKEMINSLLGSLMDQKVKFYCLRGFGNIVSVGKEEINKYAPTVLDALMSSIDDPNDSVAMEAMDGLAKVFGVVDEGRVAPILVNICHRIRPAFDKANEKIRAAAFNLFGALERFGKGSAAEAFYEQIHNNLPVILVHVQDESPAVQTSCKRTLGRLAGLMQAEEMISFFSNKNFAEGRQINYEEFLNEVSKLLINNNLDRLNYYILTSMDYFKSDWDDIKANSALLVGYLLGNLTPEKRKTITLNSSQVANAFVVMLREKSPDVRQKVAFAMSLLHAY